MLRTARVDPVDVPAVAVFDPKIKALACKEETRVLKIAFKNGQVWQLIGIPPVDQAIEIWWFGETTRQLSVRIQAL